MMWPDDRVVRWMTSSTPSPVEGRYGSRSGRPGTSCDLRREGTRAAPIQRGHHWGTVCPTDPDYRENLPEPDQTIGNVGDVRLTTPGFPGTEFIAVIDVNVDSNRAVSTTR